MLLETTSVLYSDQTATTPVIPLDVRSASQGCDPPAMVTQHAQASPQGGGSNPLAGPHTWEGHGRPETWQRVLVGRRE